MGRITWNLRQRTLGMIIFSLLLLLGMIVTGIVIGDDKLAINPDAMNQEPSLDHLFGTDWLGRDMLARTLKGLALSFFVGLLAASSSAMIALTFTLIASWNRALDRIVTWLIDLFLSVPHLVLLLLISFAIGGGFKGVVIGLALTHWPSLTRILRAEMLQVKTAHYVHLSKQLGKTPIWIARRHILPHLLPQLFIGFLLLFPHAILHEAAISFLGFGLPAEQPSIGIILSESMRYLSTGKWWLAVFPGLSLLLMVLLFDTLGQHIRKWVDPFHGQKGV
ncbi:ABC transporter permease [Oceanobacillus luteolus]|uniref:ABC transporter permease n=1 Tax=Oceanobacillus luteolus TaxID=1274358 RepID=A0ABW4HLN0_9BACI|nr:ABC transporter permease [Oceanobacillus luteolus]MCM3739497.1 ABC transporter permease [Oceanobacillus luteolus]